MVLRIFASIILLLSVLFMPFWLTVVLGLAGIIYFNYYYEAVALFLLSDLLYGAPEAKFSNEVFISFVVVIIIFFALEALKKKLKFYN